MFEKMPHWITTLTLLLHAPGVLAELNVSYIVVEQAPGFASQRTYAGQVVPARAAELGFKRGGELTHVAVDIGDKVRAHQVLAKLDTAGLQASLRSANADIALREAAVAGAEAQVRLAANTEKRFRRLRAEGHTPQQTYDEAKLNYAVKIADLKMARAAMSSAIATRDAIQVSIQEAVIRAPFGGTIQARYIDEGSQVSPGMPSLRIVEQEQLELHIGVPGRVSTLLDANVDYAIRWQDQHFVAKLRNVLPELDANTRTQMAIFLPQSKVTNLPLGAVVELVLKEQVGEPGFWLPLAALTESDRGLWGVYVINTSNQVERHLVEIVHTEAQRVFARGTLVQGDRVINSGVHRIVPGQSVKPTLAKTLLPDALESKPQASEQIVDAQIILGG